MSKGMIIDLDRCIGCDACTIACKQGNGTPKGTFWTHVERQETGIYPDAYLEVVPVLCNHCKNAACVEVCPYNASVYMRDDGTITGNAGKNYENGCTVQVLSASCQGCNYCIAACPYQARTFDFGKWESFYPEQERTDYEKLQESRRPYRYTVSKCTLCDDRRARGDLPACAHTCPADARTFGDVDSAAMQKTIQDRRGYQLKPEQGTNPCVYYLPRKLRSEREYGK